ncbi:DUF6069 family protein [Geodermatophilus sp. SYSU D00691]
MSVFSTGTIQRGSTSFLRGRGLPAVTGAVTANLGAYLLLRGPFDVDLRVARPGEGLRSLEAGPVVAVTLVPAVAATGLAALLRDRPGQLRRLSVAGWAFAVLSLWAPLSLDVETETKAGLALLHLLPAAVVLPAVTGRRSRGRDEQGGAPQGQVDPAGPRRQPGRTRRRPRRAQGPGPGRRLRRSTVGGGALASPARCGRHCWPSPCPPPPRWRFCCGSRRLSGSLEPGPAARASDRPA